MFLYGMQIRSLESAERDSTVDTIERIAVAPKINPVELSQPI